MKRICSKCKIEKNLKDFLFKNKKLKTYQSACRICYKDQRKKSYELNKKTVFEKNKRLRLRNKNWIRKYKQENSCFCCKENDIAVLDFHHIKNKKIEIALMARDTISLKAIQKEINKCIILCSNCHRKLHYYKFNIEELNAYIVQMEGQKSTKL